MRCRRQRHRPTRCGPRLPIGHSGTVHLALAAYRSPLAIALWRPRCGRPSARDRKSTRLNSSHQIISYAVFCLKKKKTTTSQSTQIFTDNEGSGACQVSSLMQVWRERKVLHHELDQTN